VEAHHETADLPGADDATRGYLEARRRLCAAMADYARAVTALSGPADPARDHLVRYFTCGHAPGELAEVTGGPIVHLCRACQEHRQADGRTYSPLAMLMLGPVRR
jgi:hypothetical protein